MLQGIGSNVGKSLLVAGLARAYANRGLAVRPFKPQNMSNNAAVTHADGEICGEVGRAQALQARAARVAASVHMNPVLLKPQSEIGAQVIVQGKVVGTANARAYHALKPSLMPAVLDSFAALGTHADLILVEGAGSPAEVNLRAGDIANMGFAEATATPVILVADVERGGALAAIVGTCALLNSTERGLLKGYVINKFRGDASLFDDAHGIIEEHCGLTSLGVVPYLTQARRLPAEDSADLDSHPLLPATAGAIKIAVPRLPRIANFDDLDPLIAEADVELHMVEPGRALPGDADLVLIPGSKATRADLAFLIDQGWDVDIAAHVRRGGWVLGLCGGYQMLGESVSDHEGIEGPAGSSPGLGLLAVTTSLARTKHLAAITATDVQSGAAVRGYEMHMGETDGPDRARPMFSHAGRDGGHDGGACSENGRVQGCYLHGLFADDGYRAAYLGRLKSRASSGVAYDRAVDEALDSIAASLEDCLDLDRLLEIAHGR
jgi:adenosylcobyric acid synthase